MKIIPLTPNPSGAYPAIQEGNYAALPEGCALWPDELETTTFYEYNGFVKLAIENVQVPVGQETVEIPPEEEGGEPTIEVRDVTESWPVVSGCEPNAGVWEAWKASLPEPVEEERETPVEERVAALEEALAQTDETAIELYEAQAAQEEINAAQDEALIEIYEMIGG